jgi:hypothetical protein
MAVRVTSKAPRYGVPAKVSSALTILLLVSACKGGGGTTGLSFNYTSPYAPPPPVSGGVLTAPISAIFSAVQNQTALIDAAAANLLASDSRYLKQKANWYFTNGPLVNRLARPIPAIRFPTLASHSPMRRASPARARLSA